jgi:MFS family permease
MSAAAPAVPHDGDAIARRNALLLAFAGALGGANASVVFATGSLIGRALGSDPEYATVPITAFVVGTALATYPAAAMARRFGRRNVFMAGNVAGAWAGILGALSLYLASFELYCLATFLAGVYQAVIVSYRFAAADSATPRFRATAISWVLGGGLAAAFIGPQLVIFTKELTLPYLFLATYLAQAAVAIAAMFVTGRFIDTPAHHDADGPARPLRQIAMMPRFIIAVLCGTAAQGLMNMVMTSAPLAMAICGHSVTDSTLGIQWHIVGMYGPSFFTGGLIARYGKERIVILGLILLAACAVVNLSGLTVGYFWVGLTMLGLGWNFAFIGASAIVTDCHRPSERNRVQGLNDTLIFSTTAVGSYLSGHLLAVFGWASINYVVIPIALVCAVAAAGLLFAPRRPLGA